MSEESKQVLRSAQCARIIVCISDMFGVSLADATDEYQAKSELAKNS